VRTLAVTCGLALAAATAAAQSRPSIALRADAFMMWVHSDTGLARASLRGPGFGGEGRVAVNGLLFGLGLMEGQLKPAGATGSGPAPQLDVVQGTVFVGGRLAPWLEMTAGPVVRAYVTDSTTERWVFWQARARVDAPIVVGQLGSYLEVWRALASTVNLPTGAGRIQGGEAGVVFQPPQQRLWLRLSYRLDDALLGGPGGNETMEAITLSGGITIP
jgi:hypothetical protein